MITIKTFQAASNIDEFQSIVRACSFYEWFCLAQSEKANFTEFDHRRLNWDMPLEEVLQGIVCSSYDLHRMHSALFDKFLKEHK